MGGAPPATRRALDPAADPLVDPTEEASTEPAPGPASDPAADPEDAATRRPGDPEEPERDAAVAAEAREAVTEIFHDLTEFDWYRRGEPIRHAGRAYDAGRVPARRPPGDFRELGRFGGVAYWAAPSPTTDTVAVPDTLFVPVFPGYWQPFVRQDGSPR